MSSRLAYAFVVFIMLLLGSSIVQIDLAIPYIPYENALGNLDSNLKKSLQYEYPANHSVEYKASLTDYGSLVTMLKNAIRMLLI